jgi:hypothetical protein
VDFSAAANHNAKDTMALFAAGGSTALLFQTVPATNTGQLTFTPPSRGQYEFRYIQSDGAVAAVSNRLTVQ